jgi:hypothetical protein
VILPEHHGVRTPRRWVAYGVKLSHSAIGHNCKDSQAALFTTEPPKQAGPRYKGHGQFADTQKWGPRMEDQVPRRKTTEECKYHAKAKAAQLVVLTGGLIPPKGVCTLLEGTKTFYASCL